MKRSPETFTDPSLVSKDVARFVGRVGVFVVLLMFGYVISLTVAVNLREGGMPGMRFTNIPLEAPTFGGQTSLVFDEVESVGDVDILWIGSSHAYRTFDPRFFDSRGISSFNLGTTAQTPLNTFFIVEQFADRVKPRLVVMEVYWNVLTWDGVESTLDIIANSSPSLWMLKMAFVTRDVRAINAYTKRMVDFRRPQVGDVQPNLFEGDSYIGRGFVEKAATFAGDRVWPVGELSVRANQLAHLSRTIQLVKDEGLPIVLITQPLPQATLRAMTNHDELRAAVDAISRRHDVPYLDFNGLVELHDLDDFFDSHHLSQAGLGKFLPAVYEALVNMDLVATAQ